MQKSARVLGPYKNGEKWRLVVLDGESRKAMVADTHETALALRKDLQGALKRHIARSFEECLEEYLRNLVDRGVSQDTADKVRRMLRPFLPLAEPLTALDAERAAQMYFDETKRTKSNGEPIANDSHHLLLRRVKHFYKWAISRRYITQNPFAEVSPIGRPKRGKQQLRIDEARKLVSVAIERARTLDAGSTAILMQIFLGLRPTEALVRVVRDLDDEGRVLWVPFGKTSNAKRRLQVPDALREVLLLHAKGKPADAPLLGNPEEPFHTRDIIRYRLKLLCQQLGLPTVCPHSLRGLNATLALDAGATAQHVAAALGHASFTTTARHYADASSVANVGLRRVADLLGTRSGNGSGSVTTDVEQLATLLQTSLSPMELQRLRQLLPA
ncbi:MAG: tyrosine-type recombinase/integrase [Polyangia bacterium]